MRAKQITLQPKIGNNISAISTAWLVPLFSKGGGLVPPLEKRGVRGDFSTMLEYNKNLKHKARHLRSNMTDSEQLIWSRVRRKQVLGIQFYRQKPIGNYIVDFYAPAAKLVVEIDGSQHLEVEIREKDLQRTRYLENEGLRVLRFDNLQVLSEIDGVVEEIFRVVEDVVGN